MNIAKVFMDNGDTRIINSKEKFDLEKINSKLNIGDRFVIIGNRVIDIERIVDIVIDNEESKTVIKEPTIRVERTEVNDKFENELEKQMNEVLERIINENSNKKYNSNIMWG